MPKRTKEPDRSKAPEALEALEAASERWRAAERHERCARTTAHDALRAAFAAGVRSKDIVRVSGLTRTSIYRIRDRVTA